jgi:hypothetical protein
MVTRIPYKYKIIIDSLDINTLQTEKILSSLKPLAEGNDFKIFF